MDHPHPATSRSVKLNVNSKPEQKVDSLPLLGLDPATIDTPTHHSIMPSQIQTPGFLFGSALPHFAEKKK
jgi:hypothetical protein